MFDSIYQLSPEEKISDIEGHLLVFVRGSDHMSELVAERLSARVGRLSETSHFQIAFIDADQRPTLTKRAPEFPALFHFRDGRTMTEVFGVDDCMEFFTEFILTNRPKGKASNGF